MADGYRDDCDATPTDFAGCEVSSTCRDCGHMACVHGVAGCGLCSFGQRLHKLEERLAGIVENHHLWDGS